MVLSGCAVGFLLVFGAPAAAAAAYYLSRVRLPELRIPRLGPARVPVLVPVLVCAASAVFLLRASLFPVLVEPCGGLASSVPPVIVACR